MKFSTDDYRSDNVHCELARIVCANDPTLGSKIFGASYSAARRGRAWAHHIDHIAYPCRADELANVLHLSWQVHNWLHSIGKPPAQVIRCWAKKRKGELDFARLAELSRQQWPGKFETDLAQRLCVGIGDWCERMRLELIRSET